MNNKTTKILQLGRNIYSFRKQKGLSQNQLAEIIGISREHLAKIETAKRCVSLGLLIDISEALDTPVRDFFRLLICQFILSTVIQFIANIFIFNRLSLHF